MSKILLKGNQLSKNYGRVSAVTNLSFEIRKGSVYGILGPNGSGKSTTLGIVLNVVNASSGSFEWFEGDLSTKEALKKVGAIIERPNFYPYMSARENLELVCLIKEIPNSAVPKALKEVGLEDRSEDLFSTFSLGMKQRLAIASALLNDPEILILDEPTNGLDPQGIHQIRELIKEISKNGTTILLASHLLDEVEKVCTHVVVLRKGVNLYSGRVDELISSHGFFELKTHQKDQLISLIESHPNFSHTKIENDLITAFLEQPMEAEAFNRLLFKNGIVLSHLVKRKESLEEQFLQLTDK